MVYTNSLMQQKLCNTYYQLLPYNQVSNIYPSYAICAPWPVIARPSQYLCRSPFVLHHLTNARQQRPPVPSAGLLYVTPSQARLHNQFQFRFPVPANCLASGHTRSVVSVTAPSTETSPDSACNELRHTVTDSLSTATTCASVSSVTSKTKCSSVSVPDETGVTAKTKITASTEGCQTNTDSRIGSHFPVLASSVRKSDVCCKISSSVSCSHTKSSVPQPVYTYVTIWFHRLSRLQRRRRNKAIKRAKLAHSFYNSSPSVQALKVSSCAVTGKKSICSKQRQMQKGDKQSTEDSDKPRISTQTCNSFQLPLHVQISSTKSKESGKIVFSPAVISLSTASLTVDCSTCTSDAVMSNTDDTGIFSSSSSNCAATGCSTQLTTAAAHTFTPKMDYIVIDSDEEFVPEMLLPFSGDLDLSSSSGNCAATGCLTQLTTAAAHTSRSETETEYIVIDSDEEFVPEMLLSFSGDLGISSSSGNCAATGCLTQLTTAAAHTSTSETEYIVIDSDEEFVPEMRLSFSGDLGILSCDRGEDFIVIDDADDVPSETATTDVDVEAKRSLCQSSSPGGNHSIQCKRLYYFVSFVVVIM